MTTDPTSPSPSHWISEDTSTGPMLRYTPLQARIDNTPPTLTLAQRLSDPDHSGLRSPQTQESYHSLEKGGVMTPPMVGSTWPRVRSTLGSDCLPALSQGTILLYLFMDLLIVIFPSRRMHVRCPMSSDLGVVLVRFTYLLIMHVGARSHGTLYPMTGCVLYLGGLLCW